MSTITDSFPGSSLDPAWNPATSSDPFTVSGGVITVPTGTAGIIARTESGFNLTTRVKLNQGSDGAISAVGVGPTDDPSVGGLAVVLEIASGFLIVTDTGNTDTNLTGFTPAADTSYILELVVDASGVCVGTVYDETMATTLATTSITATGAPLAALAAALHPFLELTAGGSTSLTDFYADPIGGEPPPPPPPEAITGAGLIFSITTLHYPAHDDVDELLPIRKWRLTQFTDGQVEIPLNDQRTAKVTISVYDPACQDILPLERFLHVRYLGKVVFWGPMTDPVWDVTDGTVTINALGAEWRSSKAFVREGDTINGVVVGNSDTDPDGTVGVDCPITSDGMWDIVSTSFNTDEQAARGVPDIGIDRGLTGDGGSTETIKVSRGDETFGTVQKFGEALLGPDFSFEPQDMLDGGWAGNYVKFNTFDKKGADKTGVLRLQYNWGQNNLDGYQETPSGTAVVTHAHRLSADGKNRGTAAATGPSARFGVYVDWDAIEGNPAGDTEDDKDAVLAGIGKVTVEDYGEPPAFITIVPKLAIDGQPFLRYGSDYVEGDEVHVSAHKGFYRRGWDARITKVTLSQTNAQRSTLPAIEVVPKILDSDDVSATGDGA